MFQADQGLNKKNNNLRPSKISTHNKNFVQIEDCSWNISPFLKISNHFPFVDCIFCDARLRVCASVTITATPNNQNRRTSAYYSISINTEPIFGLFPYFNQSNLEQKGYGVFAVQALASISKTSTALPVLKWPTATTLLLIFPSDVFRWLLDELGWLIYVLPL